MQRAQKRQWALFFAWIIALSSFLSTLYLSEALKIPACHLCWYQRICIYPLVIILGIASFRNDGEIARYTIPLTLIGFVFGLYQYLEQMIPNFAPIDVCGHGPSCSTIHIQLLGFITFPFLSMLACLLITVLLSIVHACR